jgi:hypothetical protein
MTPAKTTPGIRGGGMKENGGRREFMYAIFDTLQETVLMPQCTPTQYNNKGKKQRNTNKNETKWKTEV